MISPIADPRWRPGLYSDLWSTTGTYSLRQVKPKAGAGERTERELMKTKPRNGSSVFAAAPPRIERVL